MNTKDTDILNVILIIVSLMLAFNLPFGLFIFSYAILGPLHYLTEINWLKEKKYFVKNTSWIWLFVVLGCLISIPFLFKFEVFSGNAAAKKVSDFIASSGDEIILVCLLFAIGLIYFKQKLHLLLFLMGSIAVALPLLYFFPAFALAIAIFIPTVIHVYLFTLLFMIYGTMHSKSTPGILAIVLLILVPIIITVSKINPADYFGIRDYTKTSFDTSNFGIVSFQIAKDFLNIDAANFGYFSAIGIKIQIFIAFAYTYHYLNWFSKTSVIGWNKNMSKNKTVTILSIWVFSIILYLYNFKIGFIVLSALSLIHVFLEFPLNVTSIKGIVQKIKS